MRLEVGKKYDHYKTGSADPYEITAQYGPELFEGRHLNSVRGHRYFFNGEGYCIGTDGSEHKLIIPNFRLKNKPEFEVRFIHTDGSVSGGDWCRVSHCSAIWDNGSSYLVRQIGDNKTLRVMQWPEFKELRDSVIKKTC